MTVLVVFDNCDSLTPVNGSWHNGDANSLEIDVIDKKEGSGCILGTFSGNSPGWGGMFYKRDSSWNLEATPILRFWIKLGAALPESAPKGLNIVTTGWKGFNFLIFETLPIGTWTQLEVDLRQPDEAPIGEWPNLTDVIQMSFYSWNESIPTPTELRWDGMEVIAGPPLDLEGIINPATITGLVSKETDFEVYVRGGTAPYTYAWYVNGVLQSSETSTTFSYIPATEDTFTIKCTVTDAVFATVDLESTLTAIEGPPPTPESLDVLRSDIRGMFINQVWDNTRDWILMAEVCYDYGINAVFIDLHSRQIWNYNEPIQDPEHALKDLPELRTAISAFHDKGLHVHILYALGIDVPEPVKSERTEPYGPYWWLCFEKAASKTMMRAIATELSANYDIDGFMFDYTRYQTADECFCSECQIRFKSDTGLTDAVFPTDVVDGGKYYWDFLQWRIIPVTEMLRDMRLKMLLENPDLVISAVVLEAFQNCGNFATSYSAQHTADWVDKGYLDFVSPMVYSTDLVEVADNTEDSLDYYVGGAEGKIPVPVFSFMYDKSVALHTSCIQAMIDNGSDGWIIWRYGGPGLTAFGDIRPYLTALMSAGLMDPVWFVKNISSKIEGTNVTISWLTSLASTSKVEYKDTAMFVAQERSGDFGRPIIYKDINYGSGNVVQNLTPKIDHALTIPMTEQTQIRVQSSVNGITITSKPTLVSDIPPKGSFKLEKTRLSHKTWKRKSKFF